MTEHHRFLLKLRLEHYEQLEAYVERLNTRIGEALAPSVEVRKLLETIPGIAQRAAEVIMAEVGTDVKPFRTSEHLASWAGLCPGNNESAGKRKSGQTTKGNSALRTALVEAAWAATRTKGTYLGTKYHRLVKRMPKKKALVAVAHTMLVIVYHLLSRRVAYTELGSGYVDRQQVERQRRRLVERLAGLGVKVTIEEVAEVA